MANQRTIEGGQPVIVPLNRGAKVRGDPSFTGNLHCACGEILVENYDPGAFIDIGFECYMCRAITSTPLLPDDEAAPSTSVMLEPGRIAFGSIVELPGQGAMASKRALDLSWSRTAARVGQGTPLFFNREDLDRVAARYDELIGGKLPKQMASLARHPAHAPQAVANYPFAWALQWLREAVGTDRMEHPITDVAISWISGFHSVDEMWRHHPRYAGVAKSFATQFLHTVPQLVAGAYLSHAGNSISLAPGASASINPDLYIRWGPKDRMSIEVKAPLALQWEGQSWISRQAVDDAVHQALKKSKPQICEERPGLLVLASSIPEPEMAQFLHLAAESALMTLGRKRRWVSGIMGVTASDLKAAREGPAWLARSGYDVSYVPNQFYAGEGGIRAGAEPGSVDLGTARPRRGRFVEAAKFGV